MHHTEDDNVEPIMTVAANFEGKWLRANDPTKMYTIKKDLVVLRDGSIKIIYHNGAELSLLTARSNARQTDYGQEQNRMGKPNCMEKKPP